MRPDALRVLRRIKLLHTAVWAFFASCVVGIPVATAQANYELALILIVVVAAEVVVLLVNGMRCPLTGIAARHTQNRQDNFDIYLPLWLARYNKHIFGALYLFGLIYTLMSWRMTKTG